MLYMYFLVCQGQIEEAKREPPCEHRIRRNEAAIAPFFFLCATTGLSCIVVWYVSGATSRGAAVVTCLNAAARTLRAGRAVQGDVLSAWQVFHGTPTTPLISAHLVARFDAYFTLNLLINNELCHRYNRFNLMSGGHGFWQRHMTKCHDLCFDT